MEVNLTPKYVRKTFVDGARNIVNTLAEEIKKLEETIDELLEENAELKGQVKELAQRTNFELEATLGMYRVQMANQDRKIEELENALTRERERNVRIERQENYGRC